MPNTLPTITPVALMGATGDKPARGEVQSPTPVKAECIRSRVHVDKVSSEARAHTISAQTASPLPLRFSSLDFEGSGGGTPIWDSCQSDELLDMSDAGQFVQTEQDFTEFPECDMVDDDSPPQSPPALGPAYDFPSGAAGLDEGKERDELNPCVDQWDQTSCERASRPSGHHRGAGDGQEISSTLIAQPRVDHPGSSTGGRYLHSSPGGKRAGRRASVKHQRVRRRGHSLARAAQGQLPRVSSLDFPYFRTDHRKDSCWKPPKVGVLVDLAIYSEDLVSPGRMIGEGQAGHPDLLQISWDHMAKPFLF